MIVLNARVILQEKKIRAVQFTNCTALSDATLCQSHLQEKKIGWCNLQIAPPYLMLLHVKVILQEKKIRAVQFTICTALFDATLCQSHFHEKKIWAVQFTNCTTLSEATLWQSHLQEKKNLGSAIYKLHRPI